MNCWTNRSVIFLLAVTLGSAPPMLAQRSGSPSSGAGSGAGSTATATTGAGATRGTTTSPTTNSNPTVSPNGNDNTNTPFGDRPIFLSGKVMFDDGSPMNQDVQIERVCGVNSRTEAHADGKGHFSFQLGNNNAAAISAADASQSGFGMDSQNRNSNMNNSGVSSRYGNDSEQSLWGCELRASYPGYRSDLVPLSGRRSMDDPNVGVIILHRLSNVQGTTISLTTAQAPKAAQKNFDKGMQAARKGKTEEAEKYLLAATSEYPKYAVAWFNLGQLEQGQNRTEEARKSYLAAVEADRKYVSPFDQLALLAARENKWQEAADYSRQAITLNPVEFPSSFWYNTVANFNLNQDAEAAKSGEALLKLDTRRRYPEVNRVLSEISLHKKDYAAAAGYLKAYLQQVPTAKDAETLKQQLLKIEEASAAAPK